MQQINVLLIASENSSALHIKQALSEPSIKFLGARSLNEVLKENRLDLHPDVILIPEAIGKPYLLGSISQIKSLFNQTKVLVLGEQDKEEMIMEIISMGCDGYISSSARREDLIEAIKLCNKGLIWAPRRVLSRLIYNFLDRSRSQNRLDEIQHMITPREGDVLRFLIKGWTNKEIAQVLGVDEITVKVHISHLLRKLKLKNRGQLISHLVSHHWEG